MSFTQYWLCVAVVIICLLLVSNHAHNKHVVKYKELLSDYKELLSDSQAVSIELSRWDIDQIKYLQGHIVELQYQVTFYSNWVNAIHKSWKQ